MSSSIEIPLKELKKWLENETGSILSPVQAKAEKLLGEMHKAHEELTDACRMLLENSRKEIEKRNTRTFKRARALNKLARLFMERMQQVKVPEKHAYKSLKDFVEQAQKAYAVTDVDVRNWFPRFSPFFIMDRSKFVRVFEKTKDTLKELNDFLGKEYVKTKVPEETFQLIEEVKNLEEQTAVLEAEIKKVKGERARLEREIADAQQRMDELKLAGGISQLREINTEIEKLRKEVCHHLRHLQKPFLKLQSLALRGEGSGLTPEENQKLNVYLTDPFEALATEEKGYPLLKGILQKLSVAMDYEKLKLKQDKERKARQTIGEILNGDALTSLHQRCSAEWMRKNKLSSSSTLEETRTEIQRLQEQIDQLEKTFERLKAEEQTLERSHIETLEKIKKFKSQMEQNIFNFTGKKVSIV
ncbi:MAG: coiled-coil domain-containing protein [Candidatus Bathycorpusculaceae bacterium]